MTFTIRPLHMLINVHVFIYTPSGKEVVPFLMAPPPPKITNIISQACPHKINILINHKFEKSTMKK